jgi:hypothetical protein
VRRRKARVGSGGIGGWLTEEVREEGKGMMEVSMSGGRRERICSIWHAMRVSGAFFFGCWVEGGGGCGGCFEDVTQHVIKEKKRGLLKKRH